MVVCYVMIVVLLNGIMTINIKVLWCQSYVISFWILMHLNAKQWQEYFQQSKTIFLFLCYMQILMHNFWTPIFKFYHGLLCAYLYSNLRKKKFQISSKFKYISQIDHSLFLLKNSQHNFFFSSFFTESSLSPIKFHIIGGGEGGLTYPKIFPFPLLINILAFLNGIF